MTSVSIYLSLDACNAYECENEEIYEVVTYGESNIMGTCFKIIHHINHLFYEVNCKAFTTTYEDSTLAAPLLRSLVMCTHYYFPIFFSVYGTRECA